MTETKPKRRWFRFRLRTLLVVMTALCVWLGFKVNAARRQKEAVTAILKAGGTVSFDYQMVQPGPGNPTDFAIDSNALPSGPTWLRNVLGVDFFSNVISVSLTDRVIEESELAKIIQLPELRELNLRLTKVIPNGSGQQRLFRDSDIAGLARISQLQWLVLSGDDTNGSGVGSLANLGHLQSLWFGTKSAHLDDAGMEQLGKLTNLENVLFSAARLTDTGFGHLASLTNLKSLSLWNASLPEARMELISKLPELKALTIGGSHISEDGLRHLQNLTKVDSLEFRETDISDAGLRYLKGLKNLKFLHFNTTQVTAEGIRDLQKSLPNTTITGP